MRPLCCDQPEILTQGYYCTPALIDVRFPVLRCCIVCLKRVLSGVSGTHTITGKKLGLRRGNLDYDSVHL